MSTGTVPSELVALTGATLDRHGVSLTLMFDLRASLVMMALTLRQISAGYGNRMMSSQLDATRRGTPQVHSCYLS